MFICLKVQRVCHVTVDGDSTVDGDVNFCVLSEEPRWLIPKKRTFKLTRRQQELWSCECLIMYRIGRRGIMHSLVIRVLMESSRFSSFPWR